VDNGRIAFYAGGCTSCHATPGQDDKQRLGGGYALKSPFGTFHVPNISPHKQDGIGSWSTADFIRAVREGVSPKGQHYYPAFPYTSYQRMSREDVADLFAFIMTLPPVEGRAPAHELPFPFNIRRGIGLWKLAFLDGKGFAPDPNRSPEWNRGAYLVNGPGHCAECHSERNFAGAIIEERRFTGGPDPEGRGTVPNITPHPTGIGGWTAADLATLLKTGETPNFDTVGGPMADVVRNTAQLSDADRQAMAEYLLSLPAREGVKGPENP
jgi:mono/diheme cytochrome c family protein